MCRCKLVQLGKDTLLEVGKFGHGFDDQIGSLYGSSEIVDGREVGRPCVPLFGCGLAPRNAFSQKAAIRFMPRSRPSGKAS